MPAGHGVHVISGRVKARELARKRSGPEIRGTCMTLILKVKIRQTARFFSEKDDCSRIAESRWQLQFRCAGFLLPLDRKCCGFRIVNARIG